LNEVCESFDVPTELVSRLIDVERSSHGLKRRHAIHSRIDELFRQEWRDRSTIVAARMADLGVEEGFDGYELSPGELEEEQQGTPL
jgi:DNA sulfur modification protein DndC